MVVSSEHARIAMVVHVDVLLSIASNAMVASTATHDNPARNVRGNHLIAQPLAHFASPVEILVFRTEPDKAETNKAVALSWHTRVRVGDRHH
jgi:hypothetical protein